MAEATAKRETMASPQGKIARRELIRRGAALGATAVVVGAAGTAVKKLIDTISNITKEPISAVESKYPTAEVYEGEISIQKVVNLRTSPLIPLNPELDNTLSWDHISKINNSTYQGQQSFVVKNPEIVKGQDPDKGYIGDMEGRWIKFKVMVGQEEKLVFVNISSQTAGLVNPNYNKGGKFLKVQEVKDGLITTEGGRKFTPQDIGLVRFNEK